MIINLRSDLDVLELLDKVESTLYLHAKIGNVDLPSALRILEEVEGMIFVFTYKTEISRVKYEKDTSPVIDLIQRGVFGSKTRYWEIPNPSYS